MKNMSTIKTKQLDPAFVERIGSVIADMFRDLPPKYLNKSKMTGATFVRFLEDCIKQLNDPENNMPLSIPNAHEVAVQYVAQRAYESCLKAYENQMTRLNKKFPIG